VGRGDGGRGEDGRFGHLWGPVLERRRARYRASREAARRVGLTARPNASPPLPNVLNSRSGGADPESLAGNGRPTLHPHPEEQPKAASRRRTPGPAPFLEASPDQVRGRLFETALRASSG
jgi:hypothetical protein